MTADLYPERAVLMVDDEEQFLLSATTALSAKGINHVVECSDSRKVLPLLAENEFSLVVLDLIMPYISGLELLEQIRDTYPDLTIIMLTAIQELETAVRCMQLGAFDYLVKPVNKTRLVTTLKRAIEYDEMKHENNRLKHYLLSDELQHPQAFAHIITQNPKMQAIFQYLEAIAPSPLPVLLTGETGVGKELFAEAIHRLSGRPGELVTVNVAGLDDHLFSDTLFGHKKGAFTGADQERKGLIEKASGGTLFLDEIGDLRMESQVKLLRLIQEKGEYYPIGSDTAKACHARIIVATNANLEEKQRRGDFRKDLYYRLRTYHVDVPPLRDRRDDLPLLVEHFFDKAARSLDRKKPKVPRELITLLQNYSFPGNVRELEAMAFDALSRHRAGRLSFDSFREKIIPEYWEESDSGSTEVSGSSAAVRELSFPEVLPTIKEVEQLLIEEALRRTDGNQRQAAELIGLSRRALNNRLNRT